MKRLLGIAASALLAQSIAHVALAEDDFYGIVESRPDGKAGTWVIGGRSVEVTEKTELDEDKGPLEPGVCAEVEIDDGMVEQVESEPPDKCAG